MPAAYPEVRCPQPKYAIALANRRLLVAGVALLAVLLPALRDAAVVALAVEAALCISMFFLKAHNRTAAWRVWESSMQSVLVRTERRPLIG